MRVAWTDAPLDRIKETPHVPNGSVTVAEYRDGSINWLSIGYADHLADKITEEGIK